MQRHTYRCATADCGGIGGKQKYEELNELMRRCVAWSTAWRSVSVALRHGKIMIRNQTTIVI